MYNKSSTSLAIISTLSILIVLFIAVSNVEDAPIRRPFPTQGADTEEIKEGQKTVFQEYNDDVPPADSNFEGNFSNFVDKVQEGNQESEEVEFGSTSPVLENIDIQPATSAEPTSGSTQGSEGFSRTVNTELLTRAGFKNFFIKPRPFDGVLFETFDVSMLSYLNVLDRKIFQIIDGNEVEILRIYEFNLDDSDAADEIYTYLKTSLKEQLGVSVNETNQFGLSSFYINYQAPQTQAFLVVKTKGNVYALSYPKSDTDEIDYFKLVSNLVSELV